MLEGTNVNEILESAPSGKFIFQLVGNGWRPRSTDMHIITEDGTRIKMTGYDIKFLRDIITEFLKGEDGVEK